MRDICLGELHTRRFWDFVCCKRAKYINFLQTNLPVACQLICMNGLFGRDPQNLTQEADYRWLNFALHVMPLPQPRVRVTHESKREASEEASACTCPVSLLLYTKVYTHLRIPSVQKSHLILVIKPGKRCF